MQLTWLLCRALWEGSLESTATAECAAAEQPAPHAPTSDGVQADERLARVPGDRAHNRPRPRGQAAATGVELAESSVYAHHSVLRYDNVQ